MLVDYHLDRHIVRISFLFGVICLASLLVGGILRAVLPSVLAGSDQIARVQTTLAFDSSNDRILHRLGLLYFWSDLDTAKGLPLLRRAAQLSPYSAQYQLDLGIACNAAGDNVCADSAFVAAAKLASHSPRFHRALTDHYLVTGRTDEALHSLQEYLDLYPDHPDSEFETFLRATGDAALVWNYLPNHRNLQVAFITFLGQKSDFQHASVFWKQLVSRGDPVDLSSALPYIRTLEASSQFGQLTDTWRDLQRMRSVAAAEPGNLLTNGSFESEPANIGLDWHLQQQQYVTFNFADTASNQHSLRVDFTANSNANFDLIQQIVPVVPATSYKLTASVQSRAITSDEGPRLRVQDLLCSTCLDAATDGTTATTGWHEVSATFSVGSTTKFLRLSLWRPRSRSYPSEITGQFWISNICLRPLSVQ